MQAGFIAAILGVLVAVGTVPAHASDDIPEATPGASRTIFLDISVLSRKKRGAEKIDEAHAAHFAKGWTAVDMEVYTENGDLQGYFLTYVGRDR